MMCWSIANTASTVPALMPLGRCSTKRKPVEASEERASRQTVAVAGSSEVRYADSGDVSIAYQVIGSGDRDIVFVPGVISHVEFFHELPGYTAFLNGLASFGRVIVFDKRGNGLSDRITGAPPLEERMDDVRAVMDAAGSERAVLFGVSEGGPITLLFAATYPARVESVVLYETFVRYGGVPGHFTMWEPDAHQQFTEMLVQSYGTGASIAAFGTSHVGDPHVQELWGQAERVSNSPGGFRAVYGAMIDMDATAALPSVQAPCLVIHSAGSMFADQGRYLAEHLPDAHLLVLDGVDHYPWFANGDLVVSEVEEFVTGTRTAAVTDRVLATIVFIDIVGSTEHAADVGDHKWHDVIDRYYALARRQLERFRGQEVSTAGDGVLARFDGPARAVSWAHAIRDAAHSLGIEIRAGVHTGEIELRNDDATGLAIHIAARVIGKASPNEVLVSRTVKDLVVGSGIEFADRGIHDLKGVPEEWHLYAVTAIR